MKIACVGNCQLESLAWYIKYLLPKDECWWISFSDRYKGYNSKQKLKTKRVKNNLFTKDFIGKVRCPHEPIEYIKSCDYVIYIKMSQRASPNYHTEKLETYINENCKSVSVSNYYITQDKYTESLNLTITKEKLNKGLDISIAEIMNQENKNEMLPLAKREPSHPPSNYFLKLLQLICNHFDWQYFSEEDHEMFLKVGFPHGSNTE